MYGGDEVKVFRFPLVDEGLWIKDNGLCKTIVDMVT